MKRSIKRDIFMILIGVLITSLTIVLADTINSNEVLYDNSNSSSKSDDVQGAIDGLYNIIDKVGSGFALVTNNTTGLSTELVAGLYRYQGIQDANNTVDNYICFGTTNKSDCTSNTDAYMYRIIGINENGQMKLIKKEALNTAYQWNSSGAVDWAHSDLYNGLNGSYFLTNTTYVPDSSWSNRIVKTDWHLFTSADTTISTIAERELGSPDMVNAKIGLMYLTDYAYSLETPAYSNTSWMPLSKSDTNSQINRFEWIMSRYGTNYPWVINYEGGTNYGYGITQAFVVRPVFFLRAGEIITSGSGTITDPYVLS